MPGYSFLELSQGKPERDRQEQELRLQQMQQGIEERDFELRRRQAEEDAGLTQKEITRKGIDADMAITEANYKKAMQAESQGVMTNELHNMTVDSKLRQSANIWRAFKGGHKDLALKWASDSALVSPGQEFSDMKLEDSDQKDANGKPIQVLTLVPKGEGQQPIQVPVPVLDNLERQFGATYKIVDKSLVRIGHDGTVTPVYEPDQFAPNAETGVPFSKRTGQPASPAAPRRPVVAPPVGPQGAPQVTPRQPAAAMGTGLPPAGTTMLQPSAPQAAQGVVEQALDPNTGQPVQPPLTRRQETHVDTRVTHATALVNHYFGINAFTQLDPKNQPKYMKIVARAGQLTRAGQAPEAASATAIAEVERAEKLAAQAPGSAGGAAPYSGPTPWRQ